MAYAGNNKFLTGIIPAGSNRLLPRDEERLPARPKKTKTLPSKNAASPSVAPTGDDAPNVPCKTPKKKRG